MVVLELLRWRAPAGLILAVVMLVNINKFQPRHGVENGFVEIFAGDAAISLALWNAGLVGSSHDIRFSKLMDMCSVHGFLLLVCNLCCSIVLSFGLDLVLFSCELRLACHEIWNTAPGGICVFGICCNSFSKMWLGHGDFVLVSTCEFF